MDEPAFDCAICPERPFSGTTPLGLGYGVTIWVCAEHGSPDFQRLHRGRVVRRRRSSAIWAANGCLTSARQRALDAHM